MQFKNIFNTDFLEFFFSCVRFQNIAQKDLVPSIRICYTSFIFIILIEKSYITKANKCCLYLNISYIILMEILPRSCNTSVSNSPLLEGKI